MKKKLSLQHIALFVGFLVVLNLLYPSPFPRKFTLRPGGIAPRDIIAPHTFYVMKDKKELQEERQKARESVLDVLRWEEGIADSIDRVVMTFFNQVSDIRNQRVSSEEKRTKLLSLIPELSGEDTNILLSKRYQTMVDSLLKVLHEFLNQGILVSKDSISSPAVVIFKEETPLSVNDFLDITSLPMVAQQRATKMFSGDRRAVNTLATLTVFFVKPNLMIDLAETTRRKGEKEAQVEPTKGIVLKGEIIVRAHDVVTPGVIDKLSSLSQEATISRTYVILGRNIMYLIAILTLFLSLYFFVPSLLEDFGKLLLLIILMCFAMGAASIMITKELSLYLVPVAASGVLLSLLLGTQVGVIGILSLTILATAYSGGDFELITLFLFSGVISVFAATEIKRMSDFYKPLLYILGAYLLTAFGVELIKLSPPVLLLHSLAWAAIGGAGSTFLAFGLLPLLEKIFNITTPVSLIEYADLNQPLMRDLATSASGSYHHSITVGNLAEAAARAIGAAPLVARVGAYYHDIGKLKKPTYFVENQRGIKNPHNKLRPELNALIVASHVKEGIELGKNKKLPKQILDIIREHHGTTLMETFYAKAKERKKDVAELDFRYPGPLPSTRESAIVMLADAIEATARSIETPTPSRLKGVVKNIIKSKLEDGQLSKVNLSLDDLQKIEDAFFPILMGVFHLRVAYGKNSYKEPQKESKNKG